MKQNFETPHNEEPNFYAIAESRSRARKEVLKTGDESILDISKKKALRKEIEEAKEQSFGFIKEHGGLSGAKEYFSFQKEDAPREGFIDEYQITKQIGNEFKLAIDFDTKIETFRRAIKKNTHDLGLQSDPYDRKILERIIDQQESDKQELETQRGEMIKLNPKLDRIVELVEYKKSLHLEGGIVVTPSVEKYIEEIEKKMITGRPIFLHGPTGTGKTSLGRRVAESLTGQRAEVIFCNEQTREADLYGRMGIDIKDNASFTKFIAGKLTRAVQEGKPIIFDEFNRLTSDQQAMIKGIFGFRPGSMVPIAGNGEVKMVEGFQIICTANLKSEKHADRKDLPDEMKREFRQNHLEIGYNPKHESFDIMLARLMNPDGSIDLSWHDINVTLPKLAEAMESIQKAYAGELTEEEAKSLGELNASNIKSQLKSFVMTQGSISDILSQWPLERRSGITFAEFIDQRLKSELSFGSDETAREDHRLAAKIFALKGFLKTVTPQELRLPADTFNGVQIKQQRGDKDSVKDMIEKSSKVTHITLKELSDVDPFNIRKKSTDPLDEFGINIEGFTQDEFLKGLQQRLDKIKGKEQAKPSITTTFTHTLPDNTEYKEDIHLDPEHLYNQALALYTATNIDLPPDFKEQVEDIWNRNYEDIKNAIEQYGFNGLLIAPPSIPLETLTENMKMEKGFYYGDNFKQDGGLASCTSTNTDKPRLILYHKKSLPDIHQQNGLDTHLNITAQDATTIYTQTPDNYLSTLEDSILLERTYFEETKTHISDWNTKSATWLPGTTQTGASRFVHSDWSPDDSGLHVDSDDAAGSDSNLGLRPSRYFY